MMEKLEFTGVLESVSPERILSKDNYSEFESFFSKDDMVQHNKAYFYLGTNMQSTRFYYADAAVQSYMDSVLTKADAQLVMKTINNMNMTLQVLLRAYLKNK